MPTTLSLTEMLALADRHTHYEFTHEIEPLMATVDPNPCWIMEPIGCEITTVAGVAQMYQRMFPSIGTMHQPKVVNSWFADDGIIGEVEVTKPGPDGTPVSATQLAWCEFNGDLICGEASYFDFDDMAGVARFLGDDFFKLPGIKALGFPD